MTIIFFNYLIKVLIYILYLISAKNKTFKNRKHDQRVNKNDLSKESISIHEKQQPQKKS